MKKLKETLAKDLWVILLDLVAVNLSYVLALLIRFYVNFQLRPVAVDRYLPALLHFAPFYSVLCIIVFIAWRLYGGLWHYAGINDMNRIIMANVCTSVIHIAGTAAFFTRMPITYYVIGGLLQFIFIVAIRFGYRVLLVEKKKIRSRGLIKTNTIVVGSGEDGRRVVKSLEDTDAYRPVLVIGSEAGTMDGIPVKTLENADWNDIGAVFIADPLLTSSEREEIRKLAEEAGAEIHDYTGYFSNLGGNLSVTELLATIHTPITLKIGGEETEYRDGAEALTALSDKYEVEHIEAEKMKIILARQKKMSTKDVLIQAYAAVAGEER